ncbi:MAG TPA: hypothetical protein VGK67_25385 [Myxococcales bacterium]|jgi:hypothetical protein
MATLELRPARMKYYLDGRPVNGGDLLELCVSSGWLTGRFELGRAEDDPPSLHLSVELERGGQAQLSIPIPEGACLRWPVG